MDALMLDGNSLAGLLRELFNSEMTTAIGTCGQCGATEPVGAMHVFRGAGVVMRCPHCGNVLLKIVKGERRVWIGLRGVGALEVAAPE
jgi:ribosomal protein S27E